MTTTAKTNIYKDGGVWCHATWIDNEFDASDPLGIDDGATDYEAANAARSLLGGGIDHVVNRIDDI